MPRDIIPTAPLDLAGVDEASVHEILDRVAATMPTSRLVDIDDTFESATVLGDTHGDWPTLEALAHRHLIAPDVRGMFVLLGDYVDRTPPNLRFGSLTNAIYALSLLTAFPDRVLCLRGNHEARRHVALPASEIQEEAFQCWGSATVSERLEDLFERLPLAAITESGAYLAHAGFPMSKGWKESLLEPDERTWLEVLWNDVVDSPTCGKRGIDQVPIDAENLRSFLAKAGADVFIRGHDPWVAGKALYGNRLLTVHSSRMFVHEGLWVATLPLRKRIGDVSTLTLERVSPPSLTGEVSGHRSSSSPVP